ncbi:MAG TPA: hypothetical protein VFP35_02220 [Candidatus Saccharimonadales bacterium]|nr:hypothetical protein [Candidatus Saccharimonadales bacterium]
MAEPARQFDEEQTPGNADSSPPGRPELRALEGGGETSPPERSWYTGDGSDQTDKEKLSGSENSPAESKYKDQVGSGYKNTQPKKTIRSRLASRKRRIIFAGISALIALGISIAGFFFLLPYKLNFIMNDLEKHYYSSTQNAMDKEVDSLFSNYLRNKVLPSLRSGKTCGTSVLSTINRKCTTIVQGSGLVNKLYSSWSQAHMENDLANKYGIEFGYEGGNYYMKAPGLGLDDTKYNIDGFAKASGESLDDFISKDPQLTGFGSTKEFKAAVAAKLDTALQNESRYTQVMFKYKVGRYLEKKFGIKRCIVACDTRRDFSDWKNKKKAATLIRAQRVLQPNNQLLAFVLGCIGKGGPVTGDCSVLKKEDPSSQPVEDPNGDGCTANCVTGGEPLSPADTEIEATMGNLAAEYGISSEEDVAKAQKIYDDLTGKGGYKKYLVSQVVDNLLSGAGLSDDASKAVANSAGKLVAGDVPGLGEVLLVGKLNSMALAAGAILPAMGYALQTQTMVHEYSIYRTYLDELKTGNVSASMVGSFTDSLGPGNQDPANTDDSEIGGTASAEQTPLYSSLIGDGSGKGSSNYLCDNGKPVPAGQLVCPEEKVDVKTKADALSIVNREPSFVKQATGVANDLSNWLGELASKVFGILHLNGLLNRAVSGFLSLTHINGLLDDLGNYLKDEFLPPAIVGPNTSGGRTFDMIAAGNDVSANDFAHNGLGGVALSQQQSIAIANEQMESQAMQNSDQPVLARLFSTNDSNSLLGKIALNMPSGDGDIKTSLSSIFSNPLRKVFSSFAGIFGRRALATSAQPDPFDITQYGYPVNDPIFNQDPEKYWSQHCIANAETVAWNTEAANVANSNPNGLYIADNLQPSQTGRPSPTGDPMGTNPCLLIQAAVGSVGGIYNSSLLTNDDLGDSSSVGFNESSAAPGDTSAYQNPLRDVQKNGSLVPQRVDQGVDYGGSGSVYAIGPGTILNISNSGWSVDGGPPTFIVYQLSSGPAQGKAVYVAENCIPSPQLKIGESVDSSTPLCTMVDTPPHIEMGWADGSALGQAAAHSSWGSSVDDLQHYTAYGLNFSQLLTKLGAPPGTIQSGAQLLGSLPSGWPSW